MLVVTLIMVLITNAYLSTAESRRALVIHDVANNGEIVRSNRFELLFTSATRRAKSPVQSAIFSPLFTGGAVDPRMRGYRQQVVSVRGPNAQVYNRVVTAPDSGSGGLGLGIFIARTLLERSGAKVSFRNRIFPAHGAIVHIMWPRETFEIEETRLEGAN